MTRPYRDWTVLPHGEIASLDSNMLSVVGLIKMPLMNLPRRMTVVRLNDSRLVIWSAIALGEPAMAKLEQFGQPAFLVVPNDHHRLDARTWKNRYPEMQVIAPAGARAKVEQIVPVDTVTPDFGDPGVEFVTVPGTGGGEAALVVRGAHGTTLVLNDLVGNIRRVSGLERWLLELVGFAGHGPQIPRVVKWVLVKDPVALRAQLLQWAELDALKRILVSHGEPIEADPRQKLRDLAASLN